MNPDNKLFKYAKSLYLSISNVMAEEFLYEDKSANFLICWMYFRDTFATQFLQD